MFSKAFINSITCIGFTLKETIAKGGSTRTATTATTSAVDDIKEVNNGAAKVLVAASSVGGEPEVKKRRGIKLSDQVKVIQRCLQRLCEN